jgi:hypothetical protein
MNKITYSPARETKRGIIMPGVEFKMAVDYGKNMRMVIASQWFSSVEDLICQENFPKERKHGKEILMAKMFKMPTISNTAHALSIMEKEGYRPATIMELLFLNLNKFSRENILIIAMGSEMKDSLGVTSFPCICINKGTKIISLVWKVYDLNQEHIRILGIKE